jgi:2-keto-4-pentenoate hydratase/2-oxohepta-3-ene-1,7-dioic acid hydratase in catechol pathway
MRLLSFSMSSSVVSSVVHSAPVAGEGRIRTGLLVGEEVIDLTHPQVGLPADMCELLGADFVPPKWLRAGDVVRIEIEPMGVLENPVVDEDRHR